MLTKLISTSLLLLLAPLATSTPLATRDPPNPPKPTHYGFLLYRTFELMDVMGPLEVLTTLSLTQSPMKLSLITNDTLAPATDDFTGLEAQFLGHPSLNPHEFGTYVVPNYTLATAPSDIDILFVPGGLGTLAPQKDLQPFIDFIAQRYPNLKYLVSVCTGAQLLAQSGVLDGKCATTNKAAWDIVTPLGPKVNWVRQARWVQDGNIWTTSGVSAGIDGTFALVRYLYGDEVADGVAKWMEYVPIKNSTDDPFA